MTVNNSNSFVTLAGDGMTTTWTFNFIGVLPSDISVILDLNLTSQITLNPTQYNLSLNPAAPGQVWGVGGAVTYPLVGSPLAVGHTITIQRIVPMLQPVALSNQGTNLGTAVEQALDLVEMQIQQVSNDAGQAVPGPPGPPGAAGTPGPVPRSYLAGFGLSNDAVAPNTTIDVAVGQCISDDQTTTITLASPFTKVINGLWVPGSGSAGLDAGTVTILQFYYIWVIYNPTLALTDILFSISATAPTLPAGYTAKRRLGTITTNGSAQIAPFTQTGDVFIYTVPALGYTTTAVPNIMTATTIGFVPRGVSLGAIFQAIYGNLSVGNSVYVQESPLLNTSAPTGRTLVSGASHATGRFQIQTNTLGQVYIGSDGVNMALNLILMGWVDTRGRDA